MTDQYLIVKGTSGLGNRMLALATGIVYGKITNRKVIVDWRDGSYSNTGTNLFFRYFDSSALLPPDILPRESLVYPEIWQDNLHRSLGSMKNEYHLEGYTDMSFQVDCRDYTEDCLVLCAYTHKMKPMRVLFTGEFQDLAKKSNIEILKSILQSEIRLKGDIQDRVHEFKDQYFADYTLGVHIRYSDMKVPLLELIKKLKRIVNEIEKKHPNFKIFIATDSQPILSSFQKMFPNVISTDKWFSTSGKRLHQNPEECPDLVQNGIEALTDLYLLASCNSLLFASRSSFGFVASLLMSHPESKLYDIDLPTLWDKLRARLKR